MLFSCAHGYQKNELECPDTSAGKLVLLVQDIPAHEWEANYFRTTFRYKTKDVDIKVSYKGNLFIYDYYIHLPWKLKLELQKFWARLDCMCAGHKRGTNETSKALEALEKGR
jgi:hypothetical protein